MAGTTLHCLVLQCAAAGTHTPADVPCRRAARVLSIRSELNRLRAALRQWRGVVQHSKTVQALSLRTQRLKQRQLLLAWHAAVQQACAGRVQLLKVAVWRARRVALRVLRAWRGQAAARVKRLLAAGRKMARWRALRCLQVRLSQLLAQLLVYQCCTRRQPYAVTGAQQV